MNLERVFELLGGQHLLPHEKQQLEADILLMMESPSKVVEDRIITIIGAHLLDRDTEMTIRKNLCEVCEVAAREVGRGYLLHKKYFPARVNESKSAGDAAIKAFQKVFKEKISAESFKWEKGAYSSPIIEDRTPVKASDFRWKDVNESSPYSSHMSWYMWWGKTRQIWVDRDSKQVLSSKNMKFKPGTVIREGDVEKLVKRDWQVNMVPKDNDKKYQQYLKETAELTADDFLLPHEQDGKWSVWETQDDKVLFARWNDLKKICVEMENGDEKYFQNMKEFINFIKNGYTLVGVADDEEVEQETE
jgi:hypothetical protein